MKQIKLVLTVKMDIKCTSPESFKSQSDFNRNDAKAMEKYLKDFLRESLPQKWQYAARVEKVTVRKQK